MRRFYAVIFIILTSFANLLNSQNSNDIHFGKRILEKIYLTDFDSAKTITKEYEMSEMYSFAPNLYSLMIKQGQMQDLESLDLSETRTLIMLCEKLINGLKDNANMDKAWKSYLIGMTYFVLSAESKRIGENLDAIQYGYDGVDYMERAYAKNEALKDGMIGVGIFKYWKSVYTKWIPFFFDEREYSYELFNASKTGSLFLQQALDYQLIFIYMYEKKYVEAISLVERWTIALPESRLFQWAGAYVYRESGQFDKAYLMYTQLYDYYLTTNSIVNKLVLLKKRALCLDKLDKRSDALHLLAEVNRFDVDHLKNEKVNEKLEEIKALNETLKR